MLPAGAGHVQRLSIIARAAAAGARPLAGLTEG